MRSNSGSVSAFLNVSISKSVHKKWFPGTAFKGKFTVYYSLGVIFIVLVIQHCTHQSQLLECGNTATSQRLTLAVR